MKVISKLVWRRFRRSKVSIIGGLHGHILIILAIFADFFSPIHCTRLT